jgi:predicted ATPase
LENLRDSEPERYESLNEELGRWLPEFDRILFETPKQGQKAFLLRTRIGRHKIKAADLSHGTLFALAFLTLAYLPNPPAIVCFEEPERGIHPRLLREIRDAMYRLCYPEEYGDKRGPVQVIATTHSPYFLDLYKDYPEEIVIAHKDDEGIHFERLSEKPDFSEFLQDAPLGEVWYSGVLGGVPLKP